MDAKKKAIWIDLDNSPHVPLFAPLIDHFEKAGVGVILTARDHSQTVEMLRLSGLEGKFTVVGRHYGKSKLNKIRGLLSRGFQLVSHIKQARRGRQIAVAVSHGSRSMVIAARWLKIPVVTMYDYEFTETTIFNRFSHRVIVPEMIPDTVLDEIGLAESKRYKYPGIKEELYVRSFRPSDGFRRRFFDKHQITARVDDILVTLRPPATTANYHSKHGEALLAAILRRLLSAPDIFTLIAPRTSDQGAEINSTIAKIDSAASNYIVLKNAVDGLNLAFASDLLISGGGTMNREAALLGVPVYSIFAGRQGALDAQMEAEGLITFIRDEKDVGGINLVKRRADEWRAGANGLTDRVERFVIEQINSFLKKS